MELRRTEGREQMSEACEIVIDGRRHRALLVELSLHGARVRPDAALQSRPSAVTLVMRGEHIEAEVRFNREGELGLRLRSDSDAQLERVWRTLNERLLREPDGRREHARLTTRWRVALVSHAYEQAWIIDLAVGGIGLQTATALQVGEMVKLGFPPLASDSAFTVSGRVCHVRLLDAKTRRVGIALDSQHDAERYITQMRACCSLGDGA